MSEHAEALNAARLQAVPCPKCSDLEARHYGPDELCWTCYARSMGDTDGKIPEPEPEPEPAGPSLCWQWADELEAPDEPDWIWGGYVAPGAITLVAGKPKSGKSTITCALAEAITASAESFLGRSLRSGGVVYLSEESAGTLKPKLSGPIRTLTRDGAWPRPSWAVLIVEAVEEAKRIGARLLIIDSLTFWGSLAEGQENDSAAMQRTLAAAHGGDKRRTRRCPRPSSAQGRRRGRRCRPRLGRDLRCRGHADRSRAAEGRQRTKPLSARRDGTVAGRAGGVDRRLRRTRAFLARRRRGPCVPPVSVLAQHSPQLSPGRGEC